VIGVLTLTGTPAVAAAAAGLVYRWAGDWAVGVAGMAAAAALTRRPPGPGRSSTAPP